MVWALYDHTCQRYGLVNSVSKLRLPVDWRNRVYSVARRPSRRIQPGHNQTNYTNTMRSSRIIQHLFALLLVLIAGTSFIHAQGITTAGISGFVTGADGKPAAGVNVTALHEPTSSVVSTTTRPNGQFDLSNLRIGGPYTIKVTGSNLLIEDQKDIYLSVGETKEVIFAASGEVVKLEALRVTETRDGIYGKTSAGSSFNESQINNLATVRRNIQDLVQMDSRIVVMSLDQGGNLSAQGQNFRFNSFLVDGVQANDPFGLNGNGFASLRSPIPLEAIGSLNVDLNPYEVRRSGFTGALINAVTKSGTNQFTGSTYLEYTDQKMRAKNPVTFLRESFRERSYGATFGGPILPGRVFFFLSYDDFRRQASPPTANFIPLASGLQQITDRAQALGYTAGTMDAVNISTQKTYLAKLDWTINENHRLSYTFRKNDGVEPSFPSYNSSTTTSLSNYWYDQPRITNSYTFQLFSKWTDNFRTEATFARSNYDGSPKTHSTPFPEVIIRGVSGTRVDTGASINNGQLNIGTDFSRQLNELSSKTTNGGLNGEYSIGDHKLLAGAEMQRMEIVNKFVQAYYGSYTFASVADWLAGTSTSASSNVQQVVLPPGETLEHAFAKYPYTVGSAFVQDTWKPFQRFTLAAGFRLDYPLAPQAPVPIPTTANYSESLFVSSFGRSSTTTNDGNYTIAPRVGFNYQLKTERKTQIRGGVGLFQGSNPAVWLANAYQNRGVLARVTTVGAVGQPVVFSPDPKLPSNTAVFPASARAIVNVTDPSFKSPVSWKGNLAIEHSLPWGLIVSAEAERIEVERALTTKNLNLRPIGTLPDGRILYAGALTTTTSGARGSSNSNSYTNGANYQNAGFADVFLLTNTKRGGGHDFTLSLYRPMKSKWAAGISWTRGNYTEVSPATSSVAQSNYNSRAIVNPNDDVDSISNTNIKDRIVASVTYQFEVIHKAPTSVSLVYQARTGHPYSWVYYGDSNGDGFTFNDLFYMPAGPTDPKVRWGNPTDRDAFFAFAQSEGLDHYSGRVVPRNSETSSWLQTFDLKFTQTIPIYKQVRTELYLNILNIANFFSKRWGIQEEVPFSYKRAVVSATYDSVNNQYVYNYSASGSSRTLDTQPITANDTPVSRWQIQTGVRVKF